MKRGRLIEIARCEMADRLTHDGREKGYTFHHGMRVASLALALADALGEEASDIDRDALFAGGLLHDVGKGEPKHELAGAARVRGLLAEEAEAGWVEEVAGLVAAHNRRKDEAVGLAARIVQDADILDHVGAQMVWLLFVYSGRMGRSPREALQYYRSDEHQAYLSGMRGALRLSASREAFDRRRALEQAFLARFEAELEGGL